MISASSDTNFVLRLYQGVWTEIYLTLNQNRLAFWQGGYRRAFLDVQAAPFPPASTRLAGFAIGSQVAGTATCHGALDELEIFNHQLGGQTAAEGSVPSLTAAALENPPSLQLSWQGYLPQYHGMGIQRRGAGTTNTPVKYYGLGGTSFTDTNIVSGKYYDYTLGWLSVGVLPPYQTNFNVLTTRTFAHRGPAILGRGHVLLLVDQTMAAPLTNELQLLKQDLIGDGWRVLRHDVPRHNDGNWSANTNNVHAIRQLVISNYTVHGTALKTLFILGHVAVPYTGFDAEDGHYGCPGIEQFGNHYGAWSSDLHYADVDGTWSDSLSNPQTCGPSQLYYSINTNAPGDGKFDQNAVQFGTNGTNKVPELGFARLDFANLPSSANAPVSSNSISELDLLRRYLVKNHVFRHARLQVSNINTYVAHSAGTSFATDFDGYGTHQKIAAEISAGQGGIGKPETIGVWSIALTNRLEPV